MCRRQTFQRLQRVKGHGAWPWTPPSPHVVLGRRLFSMERRKTSLAGRHGPIFVLVVVEGGGNYDRTWVKSRPSPSGSWFNHPSASTSGAQLFGTWLHRMSCLRHEFSLMSLCTAILVSCVPFTELISSRYRFVSSPGQTPRPATPRKVDEVISCASTTFSEHCLTEGAGRAGWPTGRKSRGF